MSFEETPETGESGGENDSNIEKTIEELKEKLGASHRKTGHVGRNRDIPGDNKQEIDGSKKNPTPEESKKNIDASGEGDSETDEKPDDFYGVDKKEIAKIFLSYLSDDEKKDLLKKIGKKRLKGIYPARYWEEEDWRNFANEIIDKIPEAKKEAAEAEIEDLLLFPEDFETEEIGEEEPEDESLKQVLEEISKKASDVQSFLQNESRGVEDVVAALEDARDFKKKKEKELENIPFEKYEEEMKSLDSAIRSLEIAEKTLKRIEKSKQEKQEKKPETAGSFVEELRKKTEEFGKTINDSTEALERLREACNAEELSDEKKKEYEKLIKEETEKRDFAGIGLAWTGGAVAAEGALEGMEKIIAKEKGGLSVEDSEKLKNLSEVLLAGISSILEGVEIERSLMQPEEVKALERLEKGATEEIQRPKGKSMPEKGAENNEEKYDNILFDDLFYHNMIAFFREHYIFGAEKKNKRAVGKILKAIEKDALCDKIMKSDYFFVIDKYLYDNRGNISVKYRDPETRRLRKIRLSVIFKDEDKKGYLVSWKLMPSGKEKAADILFREQDAVDDEIDPENNDDNKRGNSGDNTRPANTAVDITSGVLETKEEDSEEGANIEQETATETIAEAASENKEIEDMTLSEIDKSSGPAVFEARLSPNNSFAVSVGVGGSSFSWEGAEGRTGLGKIEKILFFKERDKTGKPIDTLERRNMEQGAYVIIETDHKGTYYELFMQDEQRVVLRKMEAPSHVILSPEKKDLNEPFSAKVAKFLNGIIGNNSTGGRPTQTA